MILINKGMSTGWSFEQLKSSKSALGFTILSVLHSIEKSWDGISGDTSDSKEIQELRPKYQGLVKEAFHAMYHDIHGLAVEIDLIKTLFENRKEIAPQKHFLYVTEAIEKYITNIRSIYDFMAKILRLAVEQGHIGQLSLDSFNSLVESIEKENTKDKLSEDLIKILSSAKESFKKARGLRDSIIHNGKEINVMTKDDGYYISLYIEKKRGYSEYVPALSFLAEITNEMFIIGEEIGDLIFQEYSKRYGEFTFWRVALEGVCIPAFIEFLDYQGRLKVE
ncbi:hypothetical protein M3579_16280 [Bacillus pumilus]|uniref:hypothetical protein n=1 Tax=Bacillus pumilus TaxID=1408 RepID=UPI00203DCAA3|nr:hypothetical protein [Bacillus pumilus]MCM3037520.1 hypothetical protein [Bacillus pumilus]